MCSAASFHSSQNLELCGEFPIIFSLGEENLIKQQRCSDNNQQPVRQSLEPANWRFLKMFEPSQAPNSENGNMRQESNKTDFSFT